MWDDLDIFLDQSAEPMGAHDALSGLQGDIDVVTARAWRWCPSEDAVCSARQPRPHQHKLHPQSRVSDYHRDRDPRRGGVDDDAHQQRGGKNGLGGIESAKDQSANSNPIRKVTSGARNFSGASRKEIASTIPNHTNVTAQAAACGAVMNQPEPARRTQSMQQVMVPFLPTKPHRT
jgi:hypothetical protein